MEYQQMSAAATTFSKKLGRAGKHVYDGVFEGQAKKMVGCGVEDYREIFGGSSCRGNCSIPILDVPELKETKVQIDARSSRLDYSKIFGGFGDADFAVSHEDLFAKPKKPKSSSQEARALAEARSHGAQSEHSNYSEEKPVPWAEASFQSIDGVKEFNVSCHKSSQRSKTGTNGTVHIAQLQAIPGYTCVIDEITPSPMTECVKPVCSVLNDARVNVNASEGINNGKPHRKVVSGPQPRVAAENTSLSHAESRRKSSRNRSISNDMSFDSFEIGLGTHPSRTPTPATLRPNLGNTKRGSGRSTNSKFGFSRSDVSEGTAGNDSPPLFDEEVDANSAAAVSAAAVKKAIEEAQAKIKIAKEIMERKREGLQNRVKLSSNNGLKTGTREVKTVEKANRSRVEEAWEVFEKEDNPMQVFASLPKHNGMEASKETPELIDEKNSSIARSSVGEPHSTEFNSTQTDGTLAEAQDRKTTLEVFEPSGTGATAFEFEQANGAKKIMPSANENEWTEKMAAGENMKMLKECDEESKTFEEVTNEQKVEQELNSVEGAFKWDIYANNIKSAQGHCHHQADEEKIRVVSEHEEVDKKPEASFEEEECENEPNKLHELEENAKPEIQMSEENKDMRELKEAQDWVEVEEEHRGLHSQEEMENRPDGVPGGKENERRVDKIQRQDENGKGHQEAWERVECEKKQEERWNQEENQKKQCHVSKGEDNDKKSGAVHGEEVSKVRFNDLWDKEENEKKLGEDGGIEINKMLEEASKNEKILEEDYQTKDTEKRQEETYKVIGNEKIELGTHHGAEDEKKMEATQQAFRCQGNNINDVDDACQLDEHENRDRTEKACGQKENVEGVDVTADILTAEDNGRTMEVTNFSFEPAETGKEPKAVEEANEEEEEEIFVIADLAEGFIRINPDKEQTADVTEVLDSGIDGVYLGETDLNFEQLQNEHHVTEYMGVCHQEMLGKEVTCELDENGEDANKSEAGTDNEGNENNFMSSDEEIWLDDKIECKKICDPEKPVEQWACELGENKEDVKESEVGNHKEDENSSESSHGERCVDGGIDMDASEQPWKSERNGKIMEIPQEEKTSQSTDEKEENHQKTVTMEDKGAEDTLHNEVEVEKKISRAMEEAEEREIEKEKERIAVERAIREARERAFAEARERAERAAVERAAAEAHQRAMAEARERLGKASAQANHKSAAEKTSMKAKLEAERAAVERATAEARERALEKALSEKAATKVRNQAEKFAAEKFSGASRDDGMKSSDEQYKGSVPSSSSRCPSSSNHGVSYSAEGSNGANSESTQKCKATLERHQRTAERAAKALAEKNKRDLLAQKEQAERNRLAETLDADIKRWSSGKEKNLRALLSTLQNILGPASGWQPIPLTDLVSTTAVKKAYRKATLFVHPDKLQQRGASIQQKYTCEKVFDLLKEAWNKFSAEER